MITKVSSKDRILTLFFRQPEKKFHLREIARLAGLSIAGVIKTVKLLKSDGLLISEKERVVELVSANKNSKFLVEKRAYNIKSIYECGLVDKLNDFYEHPRCIVLFGSYADGTDLSTSDVDIAVVTPLEKEMDLKKFEKVVRRKINVLTINLAEAKPGFKSSLANGIVLAGFLEV